VQGLDKVPEENPSTGKGTCTQKESDPKPSALLSTFVRIMITVFPDLKALLKIRCMP